MLLEAVSGPGQGLDLEAHGLILVPGPIGLASESPTVFTDVAIGPVKLDGPGMAGVTVESLPGGLQVAAIVTQASADRMALAAGQPATALFKASSVIVAVPA